MPVFGTYKTDFIFDKPRIRLMMEDTVEESTDKIQELVKANIRAATKKKTSGRLERSVKKTEARKLTKYMWEGRVYSDLEYTASIEYGWRNRVITPKAPYGYKTGASRAPAPPFGFLKWHEGGKDIFARRVTTSFQPGHFMFRKAATEFEHKYAEDIAERNAREWLRTLVVGRTTVVF